MQVIKSTPSAMSSATALRYNRKPSARFRVTRNTSDASRRVVSPNRLFHHVVGAEHFAAEIRRQQKHDDRESADDVAERDLQKREVAVLRRTTFPARSESHRARFRRDDRQAAATTSAVCDLPRNSHGCFFGRDRARCRATSSRRDRRRQSAHRAYRLRQGWRRAIQTHRRDSWSPARFSAATICCEFHEKTRLQIRAKLHLKSWGLTQ